MATIRIPPILRPEAGGNRNVEVPGTTIREALEGLVAMYPTIEARIFEAGELPQFLNVFLDQQDVRLLEGLDTPIAENAVVLLLPAVAGGADNPPRPTAPDLIS
ncbi:MAG TPA: MoaD/ThiS family protein [Gaiellaceae bacterium]|jgi:molybdopterin synthase sulfur carrier subunit